MLSEEVIEKVIERLTKRIEKTNTFVLEEMARSINELGTINPTKARQLVQTLKYGGDFDKIVKEIAKTTKKNEKEIYQIFDEIAKTDYNFSKKFYDYRNKKFIPYKYNEELRKQVEAMAEITAQEYINLTNTTSLGFGIPQSNGTVRFKGLKEAYYDLLDEAVISVTQGKETFDSAMFRQLKALGESGLKVIYPTGYTRRIDSAVRMNIQGAIANLHNQMQEQISKEIDADGVEISVHENPAEDHQYAQGKQFKKKEFTKLQTTGIAKTYDNKKIDMHKGEHYRPISEWNCYHYTFAIILGVDKPQYSNKELEKIIERNNKGFEYEGKHYSMYQGTQLQRKIETEIRKQKDVQIMAKASNNEQLIQESQRNITYFNRKYKELNDASGLMPQIERLKVEGYKRVNTSSYNAPKVLKTDNITLKNNTESGNIVVPKGVELENVVVLAGYGTSSRIKTIKKLIKDYPELPQVWQKMSGTAKGKYKDYEVHWYQNGEKQFYHKVKERDKKWR